MIRIDNRFVVINTLDVDTIPLTRSEANDLKNHNQHLTVSVNGTVRRCPDDYVVYRPDNLNVLKEASKEKKLSKKKIRLLLHDVASIQFKKALKIGDIVVIIIGPF